MADKEDCSELLQLPDPCLLAVLQCCADDARSMFSAARAHSRLHQAVQQVLSSIKLDRVGKQQQVDGLLQFLLGHGQHVDSLDLQVPDNHTVSLRELPSNLQLGTLQLSKVKVQLQPGSGFQGVLRPGVPSKQLRLWRCELLDGMEGLAAALALLPGLQHLSIGVERYTRRFAFPTTVLLGLQQLTHLELDGTVVRDPDALQNPDLEKPALQPLQALTRLADLRLSFDVPAAIYTSILSAAQRLTRLELTGEAVLEQGVLAALTQLQHLKLALSFSRPGRAAVDPVPQEELLRRLQVRQQLHEQLSELQALQQLTHLAFRCSVTREGPVAASLLRLVGDSLTPLTALSALTASSKLQCLDISDSRLPAGAWQHVFPAGRQLPHLMSLDISGVLTLPRGPAAAPAATLLVSCCPSLQCLDMRYLQCSAERLAPLQGLSGLHTLHLGSYKHKEGFEAVVQLTGLRELTLFSPGLLEDALLLQLTQLQRLTCLDFCLNKTRTIMCLMQQAPGDDPLWRQILLHHLDHSDPAVAQRARAGLAE